MAWFYRQYAKDLQPEDAKEYAQAEGAAQHSKTGLWADASPIPPWEFQTWQDCESARSEADGDDGDRANRRQPQQQDLPHVELSRLQ